MNVLHSGRKKALLVIDVQEAFLDDRNSYIIRNILELLKTARYDRYVVATFHADEGSLWQKQQDWTSPPGNTIPEVSRALERFDPVTVEKETRSVFKGNVDIESLLKKDGIEEVHIIGTQTHDCILASAFDAFDRGFFTYVIEECCEGPTKEMHEIGIVLLRRQNMTDHSVVP